MMPFQAMRLRQAGGAPPAAAYWNPSDKNLNVSLSDSNKVAANDAAASWCAVRGATSRNAGKRYFEAVYLSGTNWAVIAGLASSVHGLSQYPGESSSSWGLQCQTSGASGAAYHSGAQIGSVAQLAVNDYIRVAVDFDTGELWLGNPSAYVLGGDPAAGTTPTATFTPGTQLFPCGGLYDNGPDASLRLRVLNSEFAGSVPSGFTGWGE